MYHANTKTDNRTVAPVGAQTVGSMIKSMANSVVLILLERHSGVSIVFK